MTRVLPVPPVFTVLLLPRRNARRISRSARRYILAGSILSALGLVAPSYAATNLSSESSGTGPTTGPSGGNGTWDAATTQNWYNPASGLVQKWEPNDGTLAAIFAGSAGLVQTNGTLNVGSLTFNTTGYTLGGTGTINLADPAVSGLGFPAITISAGSTATITSALSGSQGFHVTGGGKLVLGSAMSVTNGISLDASILQMSAGGTLNGNTITLNGAADLQLNGTPQTVSGLSGTSGIVENASNTAATLTINNSLTGATATSFSGVIQNGTGTGALSLSLTGGAQTLAGNNTFTGGVSVASGATLNINSNTALGTGTLSLAGGIIDNTAAAPVVATNAVTVTGDFTYGGSGALKLGNVALGTAARTITLSGTNANALTLGTLTATNADLSFTGTGAAAVGAVNIGTGNLNVGGGTVTLTANSTFTGNINIDASGVLVYNGGNSTTSSPLGLAVTGGANYKLINLTNGGTFRLGATYNDNVVSNIALGNGRNLQLRDRRWHGRCAQRFHPHPR